jgi:hypothetical protein
MELYIKTSQDIDSLANQCDRLSILRHRISLPTRGEQRRESTNRGGIYYLFEVLELALMLIRNHGEIEIPEREDYDY